MLLVCRHGEQSLPTVSGPPAQAGSGPDALESRYTGSLAGKWQWVIGICKWHGQTGCFNNQDPERRSLIWWRERNRLPREPITGARGWVLSLENPQSEHGEAETLGELVSTSEMLSDLRPSPAFLQMPIRADSLS